MLYAKDYKCVNCGKQAEVFYPVFDPDIPSYPYCRECAEKERNKLLVELLKIDKKWKKKK